METDSEDGNEDLLELLGNLNEYTGIAANALKKSTDKIYIEETIQAIENVGRFTHTHSKLHLNVNSKIQKNDNKLF